MPRPVRPLDPDAGPLQRFAFELRQLRERAGGLTYQEVARRAGFSVAAVSEAARGDRLPSLAITLGYVEACGGDREAWTLRWRQANVEMATDTDERTRPPYRGLEPYEPQDAAMFFGRDELLATLIERVGAHRFVAVFGASGSGKSSLLRAGLVPAARGGRLGDLSAAVITPARPPPEPQASRERLLVVDQFEEIYTDGHDATKQAFIERLLLARRPDSRERVVIGVRADFLDRCARHPGLAEAVNEASLLVGAMTTGQLRQVIVKPATRTGLGVDPELVAAILRDAGDEPGMLPLLSHALLETWRLRRGKQLTLGHYTAAGGLHGAVARTAEGVYTRLEHAEQVVARRVFLRLVVPGEAEDTGRPASRDDFPDADRAVLERLVQARLLTQDGDSVRLAHEALLRSWPRLQDWVTEERDGLRLHRKLTDAAHVWNELGRDDGALYRGSRLAVTREWAARTDPAVELTDLERAFLTTSTHAEGAERVRERRGTRRLRVLAAALAVLLVAAATIGTIAWQQREDALSRALATEASATVELDVGGATRLALEAYSHASTTEARSALLSIAGHRPYTLRLTGHAGMVKAVAFSPDGHTLASAGEDKTVRLWDVAAGAPRAVLTAHTAPVRTVAFSPDGRLLASGDRAGQVVVWDVASGRPVRTLSGPQGPLDGVAFSPDGTMIASGGQGGVVVFDAASGARRAELAGHAGPATEVVFSGHTLLIAGADGQVTLWNPDRPDAVETLPVSKQPLYAVAVNPDATLLAAAGEDGRVHLWDLPHRTAVAELTEHTAPVRDLTFTDHGHALVSAGYDRLAVLWDVDRRAPIVRLTGNASGLYGVAASPDGRYIVSAGEDQGILIWDRAQMPLVGHTDRVADVAVDPDGSQLASVDQSGVLMLWNLAGVPTPRAIPASEQGLYRLAYGPGGGLLATTGEDKQVRLWGAHSGALLATLAGYTDPTDGVAFSPDGRLLVAAGLDGRILSWDVATRSPSVPFQTGGPLVHAVAFSPDGRLLATGGEDRTVTLWNAATHTKIAGLVGHTEDVQTVKFSPDGRMLASAGGDGRVLLWDTATHAQVGELAGHSAVVQAIAFSPDGRFLASAGLDRSVVVWDVATRSRWATLSGHTDVVQALAFSPDGQQLYSAGGDHTIVRWPLDPDQAAAILRH